MKINAVKENQSKYVLLLQNSEDYFKFMLSKLKEKEKKEKQNNI
jgi:hypothetical protein